MKVKKQKRPLEKENPTHVKHSSDDKESSLNSQKLGKDDDLPIKRFRGTKWEYEGVDSKLDNGKRKGVVDFMEEPSEKTKNLENQQLNDFMSKLEQFSDVWNDCPPVSHHQQDSGRYYSEHAERTTNHDEVFEKPCKRKIINDLMSERKVSVTEMEKGHRNHSSQNLTKEKVPEIRPKSNKTSKSSFNGLEMNEANVSELKRKKAIQEHHEFYNDQKNIIKQALSSMDGKGRLNKKVVFSDDEENIVGDIRNRNEAEKKSNGRQKLFEDGDSDVDTDFTLNHQFQGKKGHKLLELQSRFASDPRFTLDTRFYESGSEDGEGNEKETSENKSYEEEKRKQLEILESIVKQPIKPLSEIKRKNAAFSEEVFLRFDPTREDHQKYILKPQDSKKTEEDSSERKKKKKTRAEPEKETSTSETNKTKVTTEKFVAVKEDLKEVLKKDDGEKFSLLKIFGPTETSHSSTSNEEPSQIPSKLKYGTKNPFKYDSSDSEAEEEPNVEEEKKKSAAGPVKASWRTNFFFTENDPRLEEAFEFLKCPEDTSNNKEYAEKRKMLKDFIRHKFKNNNRKKSIFKKKLGGFKTKPFQKKKVKHV